MDASRVDHYLPRSLIASLTPARDRSPPARAPLILTVERLAGGCTLYRLGREPSRDCFGKPTQPVGAEASGGFSLATLVDLDTARGGDEGETG